MFQPDGHSSVPMESLQHTFYQFPTLISYDYSVFSAALVFFFNVPESLDIFRELLMRRALSRDHNVFSYHLAPEA